MPAFREEAVGSLALSILSFALMAFALHLASGYVKEGSLLFAALGASIETFLAIIIFLPLYRTTGVWRVVVMGTALYAIFLTIVASYVWVPPSLTLKAGGVYLFREGSITVEGLLRNFVNCAVSAALSSVALLTCHRLGLLFGIRGTPAHHNEISGR
jgi:hypothetical protein